MDEKLMQDLNLLPKGTPKATEEKSYLPPLSEKALQELEQNIAVHRAKMWEDETV